MLIGILSDTHNQTKRTAAAIQLLHAEGAEVLIHCGDLTDPDIVGICTKLPCYFVFGNNDVHRVDEIQAAKNQDTIRSNAVATVKADFRIGLTGTPQQIADVARAYRVYFQKVPGKDGAPYLMDHSSIVYVLDRNGRFVTHFTHEAKAEQIAAAIGKLL